MRALLIIGLAVGVSGCTIERIGPPGIVMTRAVRVNASDVRIFETATLVKSSFSVVEDVFVKDDGNVLPRELERQLRVMAGARGANALIMDPLNRRLNGTRAVVGPSFNEPFEYFKATAIWIGDGPRPEKYLGTLGGGN